MSRDLNRYVRRYTTLSSALDTLLNRHLTLLSPANWDDKNDVRFMELYRESVGAGSVLALCFAKAQETYHHWRVFTQGMEGVCLEFKRIDLELTVGSQEGFEARSVDYLLIKEIEALTPDDRQKLPYVKRTGYSDEREWRIVCRRPEKALQTASLEIELGSISRVILNPWLPPALKDNLRQVLRSLPGCNDLAVVASELTNSSRWQDAGINIADIS